MRLASWPAPHESEKMTTIFNSKLNLMQELHHEINREDFSDYGAMFEAFSDKTQAHFKKRNAVDSDLQHPS